MAALSLAGCEPSSQEALVRGERCGDVALGADVTMRLSAYQHRRDGTMVNVLHACTPDFRQCRFVAQFDHAPSPAVRLGPDGIIVVEIFGGMVRRTGANPLALDGRRYPVVIRNVGRGRDADIDAFEKRLTLPTFCMPTVNL